MRSNSKGLTSVVFMISLVSSWASNAEQSAFSEDSQSQDAGAERPLKERKRLEEVIVTAERRSADLQDVPVAVSVFTSEARQIIGIDSITDFAKFTPGLSYSTGDQRVFVRGIGRQTNTAGSEPGVANYADGLYDSSTFFVDGSDFFVDRIEVLRGPQGTLYGRNSIGGAINAISKRPEPEYVLDTRFVIGDYDTLTASFLASIPINENIRTSIGGSFGGQNEGYYKNVATGNTEGGVYDVGLLEAQVEIDFSDNVSTWFRLFGARNDMKSRFKNLVTPYDEGAFPSGYITPGSAIGYSQPSLTQLGESKTNPGVSDPFKINVNTESKTDLTDFFAIINHTTWVRDGYDIKLISGARGYKFSALEDLDGTDVESYSYPAFGDPSANCNAPGACVKIFPDFTFTYLEDRKYGSIELDFSSNSDGDLRWISGLYYYYENFNQNVHFIAADQPELAAPVYLPDQNNLDGTATSSVNSLLNIKLGSGEEHPAGIAPLNPSRDVVTVDTYLTIESYAIFGQLDYSFAESLEGSLGLRYSYDSKVAEENLRVVCFGCGEAALISPGVPAFDVTDIAVSHVKSEGVDSSVKFRPNGLATRDLAGSWGEFTGTLGLQWYQSDDLMVYGKISQGYKAGGFNAGGIVEKPQTDSEYVLAYEVGTKFNYDGILILNTSIYLNDYKGLQVPLTVPQPSGINMTEFSNLDSTISYGLEMEATAQATDALQLIASYAYSDSEINSCCYIDAADPMANNKDAKRVSTTDGGETWSQSLDGNEVTQLPRHKLSLNVNHSTEFDSGIFTMSGSYTWRDDMYASVFTRDYYILESFDQFDARVIWTTLDGKYRWIFSIKNVFDTVGYDQVTALGYTQKPPSGEEYSQSFGITPPRNTSLTLDMRF
ncbi:TonB-dependent receptor [Zhongshania sp.]|uniref:TonB-dependent receptor n=1 Tax=Zhongshania sp. TaxID=1971902 RepID=UPI002A81A6C3|nr:TonB-dependent receptor [Zhongshania sp.]